MSKSHGVWLISKYAISPLFGPPNRQYFIAKFLNRKFQSTLLISSRSCAYGRVDKFFGLYKTFAHDDLCNVILNGPLIGLGFSLKRFASWFLFEFNFFLFGVFKFRRRPKYLYVSSLSLFSFFTGALLKKIFGCKLIVEVRDIWPATLIEFSDYGKNRFVIFVLSFFEKIGYRSADLIIGTMPRLDLHVSSIIKKPFNYIHIPMGFDDTFYLLDGASILNDIDKNVLARIEEVRGDYSFIVGYSGTIGKANYVEELLEAADYLGKDVAIVIIGDGPLKRTLMLREAKHKNVFFIGSATKAALPRLLSKFDILVNMWGDKAIYKFGVSPNKWIDYMMSKRPILVTFNGYQSIINDAGCGWFIPANNSRLLAEKITEIKNNYTEEELNEIGKKGELFARDNLNYSALTEKLWNKMASI